MRICSPSVPRLCVDLYPRYAWKLINFHCGELKSGAVAIGRDFDVGEVTAKRLVVVEALTRAPCMRQSRPAANLIPDALSQVVHPIGILFLNAIQHIAADLLLHVDDLSCAPGDGRWD